MSLLQLVLGGLLAAGLWLVIFNERQSREYMFLLSSIYRINHSMPYRCSDEAAKNFNYRGGG